MSYSFGGAAEVFRDYVTDGDPSSGKWNPDKAQIRGLLGDYEASIGVGFPPSIGTPESKGAIADGAINASTGAVTGTDDTTAIQSALDSYNVVEFNGTKTYKVSRAGTSWCLEIDDSNHCIRGNGAIIALADGTFSIGTHKIVLYGHGVDNSNTIENIFVEKLRVYGNNRNQGSPDSSNEYNGIQFTFVSNSWIRDCKVYECAGDGIAIAGGVANRIIGNTVTKTGKNCIYVANLTQNYAVNDNIASISNQDFGQGGGAYFSGNSYSSIAVTSPSGTVNDNQCALGGNGISASFTGDWNLGDINSKFFTCNGNLISSPIGRGIYIISDSQYKTSTVTIATPGVVSQALHGLVAGTPIVFATTGALPTGITAGVTYYVISAGLTGSAFQFSATYGGSAVNTSGSQSGVHTVRASLANTKLFVANDNNILSAGGNAIETSGVRYGSFTGGSIQGSVGRGILLNSKTQDVSISGVAICGGSSDGILFAGATGCAAAACVINNNNGYAFNFSDDGSGLASNVDCVLGTNAMIGNSSGDLNYSGLASTTTRLDATLRTSDTWGTGGPANLATGASASHNTTLAGVSQTSRILVTFSAITTAGWTISAICTSANTITTTIVNNTGGSVDLADGTLSFTVFLR